jgi:hypothetical protein
MSWIINNGCTVSLPVAKLPVRAPKIISKKRSSQKFLKEFGYAFWTSWPGLIAPVLTQKKSLVCSTPGLAGYVLVCFLSSNCNKNEIFDYGQ